MTSARMRLVLAGTLLVGLMASACGSDADPGGEDGRPASGGTDLQLGPHLEKVVGRLETGGSVLLFRHAATDTSIEGKVDLSDCSTQRNLSLIGQSQAQKVREAIEGLSIPIGQVLASPYCRTRETAEIAFGHVELTDALLNVPESGTGDHRREDLLRLLSRVPDDAGNLALVTHSQNIQLATGRTLVEGEALVISPHPPGNFRIVGTLRPQDWTRLARVVARTT
jgi:phosphohistidine phosphatase SixA